MSYDYTARAPYSGHPEIVLQLYVRRDQTDIAGLRSTYAYELTARAANNLTWIPTPFPWSVTIRSNGPSGQFNIAGSDHLDFRGPGENVDVLARGTTPWFRHFPDGQLQLYPAAQHAGATPAGSAYLYAKTFTVDRITVPPPPPVKPAAPPVMIAENITANGFDATWPADTELPQAERWELSSAVRPDFVGARRRPFHGRRCPVPALTPGTTYHVRVRGVNGPVSHPLRGPWSPTLTVTTLPHKEPHRPPPDDPLHVDPDPDPPPPGPVPERRVTRTTTDGPSSWRSFGSFWVDDVAATAPTSGLTRTVAVFTGRITDQAATWDRELAGGSLVVEVTARDHAADLANRRIGDQPWTVNTIGQRVARILQLAGDAAPARIAPSVAAIKVTYRDVDSQPAHDLITELAASADAVAWPVVHATRPPSYWIEDPADRTPLRVLTMDAGIVTVQPTATALGAAHLGSRDVLAEPVTWKQDVADLATRIDVRWLEQGVDDDGKPTTTERHALIVDTTREAAHGQRGISLGTQLQAAPDAQQVATRILARTTSDAWRIDGLTWDTGLYGPLTADESRTLLDLLDGTLRTGHPLIVEGMPAWAPSGTTLGVYVEGGTYTHSEGRWLLELTGSPPAAVGRSVPWRNLPTAWAWRQMHPRMEWAALFGVALDTPHTQKET